MGKGCLLASSGPLPTTRCQAQLCLASWFLGFKDKPPGPLREKQGCSPQTWGENLKVQVL